MSGRGARRRLGLREWRLVAAGPSARGWPGSAPAPPPAPAPAPAPAPSTLPGRGARGGLGLREWWLVAAGPSACGRRRLQLPPPQFLRPPRPLFPSVACLGGAPVAGWVCVNGGWLPPDHPLAGGCAPAPAPAPAPSSCTTPQPGQRGTASTADGCLPTRRRRPVVPVSGARPRQAGSAPAQRRLGATQSSARRWRRRRLDACRSVDAVEQGLHPAATAHREGLEAPRLHREGLRDRHRARPWTPDRIYRRPAQAFGYAWLPDSLPVDCS